MNSKERAKLRSLASEIAPIFQIGKEGVSDAQIEGIAAALSKRELIKISVLRSSELSAKELLGMLAERLQATPVTAIGSKIILYKRSDEPNVKHIDISL